MEINSYTPYIPSNDNSGLSQTKLEKAFTEKDEKELREACQEFEATFINMLFKEMRKTAGSGDSNFALDTYQQMFDDEIANKASKGNGIGICGGIILIHIIIIIIYGTVSQKLYFVAVQIRLWECYIF